MKSTIQSFYKSLIAVSMSAIIFAACKKSDTATNPQSTIEESSRVSVTDSGSAASSAVIQALAAATYEGFGSGAVGGANSSVVYHVTTTASSGTGSLTNGIGSNKTIVFDVSGTITGRFDLASISYLTIDASGQDITINNNNNGDGISFDGSNTHHCILKGVTVTNAGGDGINVVDGAHDILISNCSSYGNRDGNIDIAGDNSGVTKNITVQWCILGGGLGADYSGDMLITGQNVTAHHNLFVPSTANGVGERCPLVHCNYSPVGSPNADFRNNVVWKFGRNNGTGSGFGTDVAYAATANVVNNYYYSTSAGGDAVVTNGSYGSTPSGLAYVSGNVSGNNGVNPNNANNHAIYTIPSQNAVATQDACTAASLVLAQAGPRPLNSANQTLVNGVSLTGCSVTPPTNQSPTVNAGTDKTITLPVSSVTLTGTASDPDGTIASYLWTKVSGTGGTITTPSAASTTITGLTAGTYVFSLKVTDNAGATATDNVTVTVNPAATTNQAPVVNAGTDKTITLPANSVSLTGTASDADGTIASYLWTKVSGTGGTITTANAASTTVTGLTAGTYVFSLTATDNAGATATDNVTVTVNPAATTNQAPVVNAGPAQTITLPVSSVTLSGSATDADGTVASYLWTKVSGTGSTIANPNSASTTVTGLTAGSYVFNLRATDNAGATGNKTVTITVNPAPLTDGNFGTLTYTQPYDVSSSVNTDLGRRNVVSFTTFRTGPGSFKSEVRAGDPSLSGGWRSEMGYTGTTQNPTEGVLEYDVYYQNWTSLDGGGGSIAWNPGTSGGNSILSLQNYSGKFDVVRALGSTVTHQSGALMTCASNTWYNLRWEFKWSTGTDGYIRLYIDNVLYYSFTGKTGDGSGQSVRIGQNRWPDRGNTMQVTSVCYYDNLKIYKR
jgi:Polysaccharide lyase/PKD domain